MNIEEILKNVNPKMLSEAMSKMSALLTPQQIEQVKQVIAQGGEKPNNLSAADLKNELKNNPRLAEQLKKNPELMQKINEIFKK